MDCRVSSTSRVSEMRTLKHSTAASKGSSWDRSSTMTLSRGELIMESSGISRIHEVTQLRSWGF